MVGRWEQLLSINKFIVSRSLEKIVHLSKWTNLLHSEYSQNVNDISTEQEPLLKINS